MRFLLLTLCLALPLAAQTPDPTPPEAYYPLGRGDIREYRTSGGATPPRYLRERVVGDTLVGEQAYRIVLAVGYNLSGIETDRQRRAVRFDPSLATPVYRLDTGVEQRATPCRLDLPFPAPGEGTVCEGGLLFDGGSERSVSVGGSTVVTSVKSFGGTFGSQSYAAGLGMIWWEFDASEVVQRLTFARIAGVEYGTPEPSLPPVGTPDPTPPWRYWPLAIGNAWEYAHCEPPRPFSMECQVTSRFRRTVVRDTMVGGVRYFVEHTTPVTSQSPLLGTRALRFDTTTATVRQLGPTGLDAPITCRLDTDFGLPLECSYPQPEYLLVSGGDGVKYYPQGEEGGEGFLAGVGYLVSEAYTIRGERSGTDLTFARIDGETVFGQPYVADEPSPTATRLAITSAPNPTAGPLALSVRLSAPGSLTVEAFDALGRRVYHAETMTGAGEHTVNLDAHRWPPGVYVARLNVSGESASTRFTVAR